MIELKAVPELTGDVWANGTDGRYRLYTVEHVEFDALPAYREGGPATVANTDWSMSVSSISELSSPSVMAEALANPDTRFTLNSQRGGTDTDGRYNPELVEHHPLDGTTYRSDNDARRAAFDAGIIAFMVYNQHAAEFGLPVA